MRMNLARIAWTPRMPRFESEPTYGQVVVAELAPGWCGSHPYTGGACMADWTEATGWRAAAMLFGAFNSMVVRDGIDPRVVHDAFLAIDEYRWLIPRDTPGAEDIPEGWSPETKIPWVR